MLAICFAAAAMPRMLMRCARYDASERDAMTRCREMFVSLFCLFSPRRPLLMPTPHARALFSSSDAQASPDFTVSRQSPVDAHAPLSSSRAFSCFQVFRHAPPSLHTSDIVTSQAGLTSPGFFPRRSFFHPCYFDFHRSIFTFPALRHRRRRFISARFIWFFFRDFSV